jgi:hypothetical protein
MVGDTVAQQKIKLICIACDACFLFRFEVIDWSEKHMAIKDLALYWEKEKNTRWFQNHPVLSETRLKFESNPSD